MLPRASQTTAVMAVKMASEQSTPDAAGSSRRSLEDVERLFRDWYGQDVLTVDEAVERVSRAIYGEEWIPKLTEKEKWLAKGGYKERESAELRILNPEIRQASGKSIEDAREKNGWYSEQRERAFRWLRAKKVVAPGGASGLSLVERAFFEFVFFCDFGEGQTAPAVLSPSEVCPEENAEGGARPASSTPTSAEKPKNPGGRPLTYNWPALVPVLTEHVRQFGTFSTKTKLVSWCRDQMSRQGSPDNKTISHAIKKHGLDKIGYRENREN
jgi:hypothetical protein